MKIWSIAKLIILVVVVGLIACNWDKVLEYGHKIFASGCPASVPSPVTPPPTFKI
jgi:hypothetical protein